MGELFLGTEKGTEVGCSRVADGTGYRHGLGEKLKKNREGEKEREKDGWKGKIAPVGVEKWTGEEEQGKEKKAVTGELEVGLLPHLTHFLLVSSSFWVYLELLIRLDWITCYISWIFWIIFLLLIVNIADYHITLAMTTVITHPTSPPPIP